MSSQPQLPGPSLRAIFATKAIAMGGILVVLLLVKLLIYPVVPILEQAAVILLVLIPTLAVIRTSFRDGRTARLIALSFAADAIAVTAGIHVGGGVDNTSGPVLYALIIGLAGLLISGRAALFTSLGCGSCYGLMVLAEVQGVLPHYYPYARPPAAALGTVVALNAYLLVVALIVSFAARELRGLYRRAEELREETLGARTVTIVFCVDAETFADAADRLGDERASAMIRARDALVRSRTTAHEGTALELRADGFLLAFARAESALRCALELQRGFGEHAEHNPGEYFHARIGLHTGEALRAGERFFGKTVILASRIAALADEGEVIASERLHELTAGVREVRFADGRTVSLKGLVDSYTVHSVAWAA